MVKKIIPFPGEFPLSNAIIHNEKFTMEISGQIGFNSEKNAMEEGIENQTVKVMEAIKKILEDAGWSLSNVIKTRIFLVDMNDYDKMNEVYSKYFSKDYPTRLALAVKELPRGALVEIDCTAAGDSVRG
jgi:2-iminobutanoate/2-iminopropanoate deaminase